MSKYHVAEAVGRFFVIMDTDDNKYAKHVYFNGYDFMGSVNWENQFSFDFALETREEAEQIVKDLESADEPDEPEDMKRIDVLRALSAAHSAFRSELEKHGIKMSSYRSNMPYTLYIDNGPTKPITILGEYDYKQKVSENLH